MANVKDKLADPAHHCGPDQPGVSKRSLAQVSALVTGLSEQPPRKARTAPPGGKVAKSKAPRTKISKSRAPKSKAVRTSAAGTGPPRSKPPRPAPARRTKAPAKDTAAQSTPPYSADPAKAAAALVRRPFRPSGWWGKAMGWLLVTALLVAFLPAPLLLVGRWVPTWYTPLMVLRLAEGEGLSRSWTRLDDIPAPLASMAIAAEDQLFCSHAGFDWKALERQFQRMQAGDSARGASTISQQTAKNLFLWDGRSWLRKGLEAWYTVQLELLWPKRRIIEAYLNIAETGPGIYGVAAAARHWFNKDLDALSRGEMARIIAILPAPRTWKAEPATANMRARGRRIDAQAQSLGALDSCVR